jgi:ribosomal protein S8
MSLKERLFGPAWESKDAETRRTAIRTEDDERLARRLPEIASGDPDAGVRLAALKRLGDEAAWLRARSEDADADIRDQADRALLQRVCRTPADGGLDKRLAWLARIENAEFLRRLAADAADSPLRRAALERIQAQGFLGDRAVAETDDALATELIERIDQPSTLKRIAKALRKRHKRRHQAVMQRLARLEQHAETHEATDELAGHLIDRVERLARGESHGDRKTEADRLEARWRELACDDPGLNRRFRGALEIVRSALAGRRERAAEETAPAPRPQQPASDAELERLTERAQALAAAPVDDDTAGAVQEVLSAFDRRWNAIRRPSEPDRALRTRFDALIAELQARLAPPTARPDAPPPAPSQSSDADTDAARAALAEALEQADRALDSGDVGAAHAAVSAARSRLDRWPGKRAPREASARLGRMSARLKEMRDWQHWSNNKLRERLIERVEEIDPAELHPDAITARLKELRARWKELDQSEVMPGDKRRFAAPQGQWRRFQKACKQVFDAAKPYLERRNELREQSLAELRAFIDDARAVVADDDAPAETLIRYQRAARQAIRNLEELPPRHRSRSAADLRGLMDGISAALDRRFEAVEAEKRRLVAEARKLAHETDRRAAIDRAKALQAEWKRAGRGRRKIEDKLWREFREPIDPLFENLDRERAERRQAENEHFEALERLCREAESLAERDDAESTAGPLAGLEEQFHGHQRVPAQLRNRFAAAIESHRARLRQQRAARDAERSERLWSLGGVLQRVGAARMRGEDPGIDDVAAPPEGDRLARTLFERIRALSEADAERLSADVRAATARARRVVIEMEFLSGLESPESDRQLRMDYQVERLSNRLGQGAPRPDLDSERRELHRRWVDSLPHDPDAHDALRKRFEAADAVLRKMTAQDR